MHLAFVDKLARRKQIQTMKFKKPKTVSKLSKHLFLEKHTWKIWIDEGTEYWGFFEKNCKEKDFEVYSTMSETKLHLHRELHGRSW